uniref:Uncharacterized protein n=1 Tax=Octactis speculum TaxID=3111310 RepID=A0A7S2ARK5_9STRA
MAVAQLANSQLHIHAAWYLHLSTSNTKLTRSLVGQASIVRMGRVDMDLQIYAATATVCKARQDEVKNACDGKDTARAVKSTERRRNLGRFQIEACAYGFMVRAGNIRDTCKFSDPQPLGEGRERCR